MNQAILVLVFGMSLIQFAHADIDTSTVPITRFLEVTADIYRGARPSVQGLTVLSKDGVKTDLDLEDDAAVVATERNTAERLGLQFINQPMSGTATPNDQQVDQTLKILNDPSNYPIFVHCKLGEDRTGLIIGLYRVFTQNWTAATAYNEMVADGFHPFLLGLKDYFDQKTAGR